MKATLERPGSCTEDFLEKPGKVKLEDKSCTGGYKSIERPVFSWGLSSLFVLVVHPSPTCNFLEGFWPAFCKPCRAVDVDVLAPLGSGLLRNGSNLGASGPSVACQPCPI